MDETDEEEELDPRIQIELEKLNNASEEINLLELELDRERGLFRQILTDSTQHLDSLSKKLESSIKKARPYYEARLKAKEAQVKTQDAALRYERACSQLMAAKEMVTVAEEGFFDKGGQQFDPAWQEMLNHGTMKVNEAEKEKVESEFAHMETAAIYNEIDQIVKTYHKDLKRAINKSRPYFEMKANFSRTMEERKKKVGCLEQKVNDLKRGYSGSLKKLEEISGEIHQQRQEARVRREMGGRGAGVGAECPPPTTESRPKKLRDQGISKEDSIEKSHLNTGETQPPEISESGERNATDTVKRPQKLPSKGTSRRRSYETAVDYGISGDTQKELVSIVQQEKQNQNQVFPLAKSIRGFLFGNKSSHVGGSSGVASTSQVDASKTVSDTQKHAQSSPRKLSDQNPTFDIPTPTQVVSDEASRKPTDLKLLKNETGEESSSTSGTDQESKTITVSVNKFIAPTASPEVMTPDSEGHPLGDPTATSPHMNNTQKEGDVAMKNLPIDAIQKDYNDDVDANDKDTDLLHVPSSYELNDGGTSSDTDTGSMGSMNMLDDDQIESVLHGFNEMELFASELDDQDLTQWKGMTLPAKASFLEEYVKFKPLVRDSSPEVTRSTHSADASFDSTEKGKFNRIKEETEGEVRESCPDVQEVICLHDEKSDDTLVGEVLESTHL